MRRKLIAPLNSPTESAVILLERLFVCYVSKKYMVFCCSQFWLSSHSCPGCQHLLDSDRQHLTVFFMPLSCSHLWTRSTKLGLKSVPKGIWKWRPADYGKISTLTNSLVLCQLELSGFIIWTHPPKPSSKENPEKEKYSFPLSAVHSDWVAFEWKMSCQLLELLVILKTIHGLTTHWFIFPCWRWGKMTAQGDV